MQEALALVRRDLGSGASVLYTRELRPRPLARLFGAARLFEVVASASVSVPSRLPSRRGETPPVPPTQVGIALDGPISRAAGDPTARAAASLQLYAQLTELQAKVDDLFRSAGRDARGPPPNAVEARRLGPRPRELRRPRRGHA